MDARTAKLTGQQIAKARAGATRAASSVQGGQPADSQRVMWEGHKQNPVALNDYIWTVARQRGVTDLAAVDELAIRYIKEMEAKYGS